MIRKIINRIGFSKKEIPHIPIGTISKKAIKEYLNETPVILEAGAADGSDTIEMNTIFPNGKIYALEPVPFYYEQLANKVRHINNIKAFQYALGDKTGHGLLNLSTDIHGIPLSSSSLLNPKQHLEVHPQVLFNKTIDINLISIDDFCSLNKIEKIDFLWLDLQGYEYQVLKASPIILKTLQVIHTEVSLIETYEGVLLYPEFKKWLLSEGFHPVIEELPWKDMGNVLFVRKPI